MAISARIHGVDVPASPFLNDKRIERINAHRYEHQEINGALKLVHEGDTVLELGSGLGIVGAVVARNCSPGSVHSYEANPELIEHIRGLYDANGLNGRISVRNEVLLSAPEQPETVEFVVHQSYLGSSITGDKSRAKAVVQVPTRNFNTLVAELRPDVLILDIEGGELALLEHADLTGVRAIIIEFHPKAYEVAGMRRCKNILRDAGFAPNGDLSSRTVWAAERPVGG